MSELLIVLSGCCFLVLAWLRLPWAVGLFLVALPVYQIRFSVLGLPTTLLEMFVLLLLAVWVARTTMNRAWENVHWPIPLLAIFLLLAGVVAVIVSPDRWAGLGLFRAYLLEPILFFYLFVNVMRSPREWRVALYALGAATVLIGGAAMLQYLGLVPGVEPYASEIPFRATAFFGFPTAIGKFVGPILAFFASLVLVQKRTLQNSETTSSFFLRSSWFPIGVTLFGFFSLVASVSRGALIGVFVAILFISLFTQWKKWIWGAALVLVLVSLLYPTSRSAITSVFTGSDVSTDVRLVMWKGTLRLIADRPIFGSGLAGFPLVYEQYKEASHTEFFPNPDHLIFTLWVELGVLGLLVFLALLVRTARDALHFFKRQDSEVRSYAIGILAALIAFFIHGFLDTPYFKNDLAMVFWAFLGVLYAMHKREMIRSGTDF